MMISISWGEVLPVLVSIAILIAIAVLRHYSETLTAIASVMPLNVPLGIWIFMSAGDKTSADLTRFTEALLWNIIPTLIFLVLAWWLSRAGYSLFVVIGGGYVAWGAGLLMIALLRGML
ncbi:MAG: hypothetical protein KC496_00895 [Anaerolineae bacterium]|nr:hypothetical protein [Anaerolineae bacterium]